MMNVERSEHALNMSVPGDSYDDTVCMNEWLYVRVGENLQNTIVWDFYHTKLLHYFLWNDN